MALQPDAADDPGVLWRREIRRALEALPPQRRRQLRAFSAACPPGRLEAEDGPGALLDLASNDYLGLSRHPEVIRAAAAELQLQGLGSGAAQLVSGGRPVHRRLTTELAGWLGRERVLLFPSGFQANIAAVTALAGRHTVVLADRLVHHSLLVGVKAAGARLQRFRHNDPGDLAERLRCLRRADPARSLLVLTESLFSMEGTSPDLAAIAAICRREAVPLIVDEAHALGLFGTAGAGLARHCSGIAVVSGTFGKAFGSGGAFLATDALLGDWLLQRSGAFRYTTALAPPLAAGALASLHWIRRHRPRIEALLQRCRHWRETLAAAGWRRPAGDGPILPLVVGEEAVALALQRRLETAGLLSVAIRPPTVPPGTSRLRLVLRQDLPPGTLARLLDALGPVPSPPHREPSR